MDEKAVKGRSHLWRHFSLVIFLSMIAVFAFFFVLWLIVYWLGFIGDSPIEVLERQPYALGSTIILSAFVGGIVSIFVGKRIIRPIQKISNAFDELSRGNFDIKIDTDEKIAEIRDIAEHFNGMVFDLSHVETLRSEFVETVSHEFKTPVAAIEGYATLLQDHSLSPEARDKCIEKITENTKKLSTLTGNILSLAKLENQETVLNKKKYRLDEQLRREILLLENKWLAKDMRFDIDLEKCVFYGNEELLDQVWFNLIDNAIKHSPQGGVIQIQIHETNFDVSVAVIDHGEGMDENTKKHIFEKFYQGDSSRFSEGSGLGLALVKRIVDLCKGQIEVQSYPEVGSVFTIILPKQ